MVKNREELLQRMIDLSGVGAEAIDTDELLRLVGIDPDSWKYKSAAFVNKHFGNFLRDAGEDGLEAIVKKYFPEYKASYEAIDDFLEKNVMLPSKKQRSYILQ